MRKGARGFYDTKKLPMYATPKEEQQRIERQNDGLKEAEKIS